MKYSTFIRLIPDEYHGKRLWRLLWCCVMALVACRMAAAIDIWWARVFDSELNVIYNFLKNDVILAWLMLSVIIFCAVKFVIGHFRNSRSAPFLLLMAVCVACYVRNWPGIWLLYSIASISFSLKTVIFCLSGSVVLVELLKFGISLYRNYKFLKKKSEMIRGAGLLVREPEYYEDGRKQFAASVARLVADTNLRDEPFTLGITGAWGSGKTLVMDEIRRCLSESGMDVIEFFPWQSTSPSNLIEDFFKTLSATLHKRSRKLGKALENYADKLIALDLDKRLNSLAKFGRMLGGAYTSINDARENIQRDLCDLKRSVVVFIDDIDRLDADELFETLRLIRNTAQFRNIAYVLAYDREYVVSMLRRKGIERAEHYLEKIFNLNMALPTCESYAYVVVILHQIKYHYGDNSPDLKLWIRMITTRYLTGQEYLLNKLIDNYRQAVSLATFLATRFDILRESMPEYSLNICTDEWYYLQLIAFFYPDVYDRLEQNKGSLLESKKTSREESYYYITHDRLANEFGEGMKPGDYKSGIAILLYLIFCRRINRALEQSIIYERNYYNYFALRVLNTEIAESDFMLLITDDSLDIKAFLFEWHSRRPSVRASVSSLFARHTLDKLSTLQAKRFVRAMLLWWDMTSNTKVLTALSNLTLVSYNKEVFDAAETSYNLTIRELIDTSDAEWHVLCDAVIAQSYAPEDSSDPEFDQELRFLSEKDSEIIMSRLVRRAFAEGAIHSVDELSQPNSVSSTILNHSFTETPVNESIIIVKNYAVDAMIDCWRELIEHESAAKGRNLKRLRDTFGYEETGDYQIDEHESMRVGNRIQQVFGSTENLRCIINELYDASTEEKEATIKALLRS